VRYSRKTETPDETQTGFTWGRDLLARLTGISEL